MSAPHRVYVPEEWPHGLRCMDCNDLFIEGQPIAERLTGMTEVEGEPAFSIEIICVPCSLAVLERS